MIKLGPSLNFFVWTLHNFLFPFSLLMMHSIFIFLGGMPSGESCARVWWSQKCSFFSPVFFSSLSLSAFWCLSYSGGTVFVCVCYGLISKMKKLCVCSTTSPFIDDLVTFSFPKLFLLSSSRPHSRSTKLADHNQLVRMFIVCGEVT